MWVGDPDRIRIWSESLDPVYSTIKQKGFFSAPPNTDAKFGRYGLGIRCYPSTLSDPDPIFHIVEKSAFSSPTLRATVLVGTVCLRSSDPFYIVSYYVKWVTMGKQMQYRFAVIFGPSSTSVCLI